MKYLDITLDGIAANLALDEALLIAAEERGAGPSLRVWEPMETAVVLGASSRLREDVREEACRADGIAIARRSSGGGTVVVGPGTLNVSVVLESDAAPGLAYVDRAHAYVLDRMAGAIRGRGPAVDVLGLGDLTLAGRKFAGSAQRRLRNHFLVHLTMLYQFPLDRVARYTHLPHRQPDYRDGRSHDDFLTNLDLPRASLLESIRSAWLDNASSPEPATVPEDLVTRLVREKFGDHEWTGRL
jgi:lipoate-protein ligase A